jgi:UDP-glucose 4-epimerase
VLNVGSDEINSVSELVSQVEELSGRSVDVSHGGRAGTRHVQVRFQFFSDFFHKLKGKK